MELLIISGYAAICIMVFTVLRIPLNNWTVPTASVGGIVVVFALVQLLNYFHPYSGTSRQFSTFTPITTAADAQAADIPLAIEEHNLVAWFHQSSMVHLNRGSEAEVTFDSIPGRVFSGKVRMVIPALGEAPDWAREAAADTPAGDDESRIPVLIEITDPRLTRHASRIPDGSRAQTAVYGDELGELALVRKTLLRMSAWMNYLTPLS